jgi:hypothetical protein
MNPADRAEARAAIASLKADYFRHIDLQQWDALEALFAPGAETDFRASTGGDQTELLKHDPAAFVASNRHFLAGVTTMHIGSMPRITFEDDDKASGIWSMEDLLWIPAGSALPAGTMHGWGHYHDRYVRLDRGWKIAATRLSRVRFEFTPLVEREPGPA